LGNNLLIESMNTSFEQTYELNKSFYIGQPLETLINKPEEINVSLPAEKQGAFFLYERLNEMMTLTAEDNSCSYVVGFQLSFGVDVSKVTAYAVNNGSKVSNIVIFLESSRYKNELDEKFKDHES
jgi:hypothetical protein